MRRGWYVIIWGFAVSVLLVSTARSKLPAKAPPGMVKIPAGWFIMGDDNGPEDSRPKRKIYLNAYYIDKYEVTNAQYKVFFDKRRKEREEGKKVRAPAPNCDIKKLTTPDAKQLWNKQEGTYPSEYANHPVTCVSWQMAMMYCEEQGKKLPTEAQWEKAARGQEGWLYPWGNEWKPEYANHGLGKSPWADASDGFARTAPVGSFSKDVSPFGVYDMAGNVWEWTRDIYSESYYKWSPLKNPLGPTIEQLPERERNLMPPDPLYTIRGGSWALGGDRAKLYLRVSRPKFYRDDSGGFRCVID